MSFLNALASDGLSVGLRLYTAKMNSRSCGAAAGQPAEETPALPGLPVQAEESKAPGKAAPAPLPLTPEERAAGRAEARAKLVADGSLGQLQASAAPTAVPGAEEEADGDGAGEAPVGGQGLTSEEEQQVARPKSRESQVKNDAQPAGDGTPQYSYTTGPDDQRYVGSVQGGESSSGQKTTAGGAQPGQNGEGLADEGGEEPAAGAAPSSSGGPKELTEEEKQAVEKLKQRDREVRAHEQAHIAAAAGLAGAPSFEYQTGPDGRRYAVGGEVNVQTSGSSDPDVALREAEAVKRAATAPAQPSGQDRAAAASASADINRIKAEQAAKRNSGQEDGQSDDAANSNQADEAGWAGLNSKAANGESFGRQVLGAYAATKFGFGAQAPRQVLARA